jgi:hypothetical protein
LQKPRAARKRHIASCRNAANAGTPIFYVTKLVRTTCPFFRHAAAQQENIEFNDNSGVNREAPQIDVQAPA